MITKLAKGLEDNGLMHYSQILTGEFGTFGREWTTRNSRQVCLGYLGAASMLHAIAEVVKKAKEINPEVLFGMFKTIQLALGGV